MHGYTKKFMWLALWRYLLHCSVVELKLQCLWAGPVYPEVGLLDRMEFLFKRFWENSILFSTVPARCYIPASNMQGLRFLYNLDSCMLKKKEEIVAILTDVRYYLMMILICSSRMISDVEHLFTYLVLCEVFLTHIHRHKGIEGIFWKWWVYYRDGGDGITGVCICPDSSSYTN